MIGLIFLAHILKSQMVDDPQGACRIGNYFYLMPCAQVLALGNCPDEPKEVQNSQRRTVSVHCRTFILEYEIVHGGVVFDPLVGEASPHYQATVTIWERVNDDELRRVAGPFGGTWVAKGCFEDDPIHIVKFRVFGEERRP